MSTFTAFERAKLSRFIGVYGNSFTFRRKRLNDYGEPTEERFDVARIDGVYHDASDGYVTESFADGSRTIRNSQPMILCLQTKSAEAIMPDDEVEYGANLYRVVRLNSVGKFGYAWDISLELIDDGSTV